MNISKSSKETLLQLSKEIVKEEGIGAINMRALAKKSGLSVGALYNYFSSKDELLAQTIASIWTEIFHPTSSTFHYDSFLEAMTALYQHLEASRDLYPNFFTAHALAMTFSNREKGSEMMDHFINHLKQELVRILLADKKVKKELFNDVLTPGKYVDYIFQLFLYGITHQEETGILALIESTLYDKKEGK